MHQLTWKLNSYSNSIARNDLDYVPTALHTLDADDKLASSSSFFLHSTTNKRKCRGV